MRFTPEELRNIASTEYTNANFNKTGSAGFAQRESISAWADLSAEEDYTDENEVIEEIMKYIEEEKSFEEEDTIN